MRNLSYLFLAFLLPLVVFGQQDQKQSVFFDVDKSELRSDAFPTLEALVNQAQLLPDFDLSIVAYTDDQGTAEYNRGLAQQRADVVRAYLQTQQCEAKTVSLKAVGKVATNTKDKDKLELARQQNRRVDILLHPNKFENFRELDAKLTEKGTQRFKINPNESILLTAQGSTKIFIPAGSLVLPDGSVPKIDIDIEIKEAFTIKDWIVNNLGTTTHDGEILQTGGMFFIGAKAGKQDLKVKKGSSLNVNMPALGGEVDPEMQLFTGSNKPGQAVTWQPNIPLQDNMVNTPITFGQQTQWREQQELDSLVRGLLKEATFPAIAPLMPKYDIKKLALSNKKPLIAPKNKLSKAPIAPDCWEKSKEFLTKKDEKRNSKYKNTLNHYLFEKKVYDEKWAKYKKDSSEIAEAQVYRNVCRENWLLIEDSLFEAKIISIWNQKLQPSTTMLVGLPFLKNIAYDQNIRIEIIYNEFIEGYKNLTGLRNYYRRHLGLPIILQLYTSQKIETTKRKLINFNRNSFTYIRVSNPWHKEQFASHFAKLATNRLNFLKSRCKLIEQYNTLIANLLKTNIDVLQEYTFSITNLGWANCDRFYNFPLEDRTPLQANGSNNTRMYLICPEINSCLPMNYQNGRFLSNNLPQNVKLKLVAIKLENGSPSLCIQSLVTDKRNIAPELVYETMNLKDLEKALAKI
jgi:OmpA family